MIEQTSYLGIPLRTQYQRRTAVVVYYVGLLGTAAAMAVVSDASMPPLFSITLILGGLFGGITLGGPIKPYERSRLHAAMGVQTLNLDQRPAFDATAPENWRPLDECERHERDQAHYIAYRIMRWLTGGSLIAVYLLVKFAPSWLRDKPIVLPWLLFLILLSLPQSVIFWTEPDNLDDRSVVKAKR
jgi:hypothetical protein